MPVNGEHQEQIRAYCEVHRIPVQMGNEEIPSFWRLRETQKFVAWLRGCESGLVDETKLRDWLATQALGPWIELLREAIDQYALETGGEETPATRLIEWLAEWGREIRRRQRGLLLVTAHGAKGLEFDHVVVLDGGWERSGGDEDADTPRRLYYVAMTRARQTLALMRLGECHGLHAPLSENPSVLLREPAALPLPPPEIARRYRRLALRNVDLGFAGCHHEGHPVHHAIAALSPGDRLDVRINGQRRELLSDDGTVVGRLATTFKPPAGLRCISATVLAVTTWNREISDPEYRDRYACHAWEVVVPELVFGPEGSPADLGSATPKRDRLMSGSFDVGT